MRRNISFEFPRYMVNINELTQIELLISVSLMKIMVTNFEVYVAMNNLFLVQIRLLILVFITKEWLPFGGLPAARLGKKKHVCFSCHIVLVSAQARFGLLL